MTKITCLLSISLIILSYLSSCEEPSVPDEMIVFVDSTAVSHVKTNHLPERTCAYNSDSSWTAYYNRPTNRYRHGILGDRVEAGGLTLIHNAVVYDYKLPENYVFEDITPRLVDINDDNIPEIVCIRAEISSGAGLVIN